MKSWEKFYNEKLSEIAEAPAVHDIGGGAERQDKRRFKKYVLVDVNDRYHPDIVADIQHLPFADDSLDAILCLSVLEHVENPFFAMKELHRVLRPGGKALLSAPFVWPYHAAPLYKDYWRFSGDALRLLCEPFSRVEIVQGGGYCSALVNFVPSFTKIDRILRPVAAWIDASMLGTNRSAVPEYFVFLVK
ncbi:class I SAM-dependent methyltransferase [Candidatus Azambacteria bacterium]|nr:class I SAM-dependent methyltransferase [Candidatus Azambacteria bacterium]